MREVHSQIMMVKINLHFLYRRSIDIGLIRKAALILSGTHNFRSFTNLSRLVEQPWQNPVKTVDVHVEQGAGFLSKYSSLYGTQMDYWDLEFKSHSFLYRQV